MYFCLVNPNIPGWNVSLSWNHNHVPKLVPQLVILFLQACPFQCLFCHLKSADLFQKLIIGQFASKSCLVWVLSNTEVPTSSFNPSLQFFNLPRIDSNLWHAWNCWKYSFLLTQLLKSIRRVSLGQDSRNISAADNVSSGCSLPLGGNVYKFVWDISTGSPYVKRAKVLKRIDS